MLPDEEFQLINFTWNYMLVYEKLYWAICEDQLCIGNIWSPPEIKKEKIKKKERKRKQLIVKASSYFPSPKDIIIGRYLLLLTLYTMH